MNLGSTREIYSKIWRRIFATVSCLKLLEEENAHRYSHRLALYKKRTRSLTFSRDVSKNACLESLQMQADKIGSDIESCKWS